MQQAFDKQDYARTLALVDSAAMIVADYAFLFDLQGCVHTKLYRFPEAQEAFSRALAVDSAFRGAAYKMGNNAFFLGRYREALRGYAQERALAQQAHRSDDLSSVWSQMGRAYVRLGVADSARWAYEESLEADVRNAQSWAWLAELSDHAGKWDDALVEARRAVGIAPLNTEYRYLVGSLLFRTGALEEAVGHLQYVVEQQKWHVGAHYNLGRCLLALGREAEAAPLLAATDQLQGMQADIILAKFAVERNPHSAADWLTPATLYQRSGRMREARETFAIARQVGG